MQRSHAMVFCSPAAIAISCHSTHPPLLPAPLTDLTVCFAERTKDTDRQRCRLVTVPQVRVQPPRIRPPPRRTRPLEHDDVNQKTRVSDWDSSS